LVDHEDFAIGRQTYFMKQRSADHLFSAMEKAHLDRGDACCSPNVLLQILDGLALESRDRGHLLAAHHEDTDPQRLTCLDIAVRVRHRNRME